MSEIPFSLMESQEKEGILYKESQGTFSKSWHTRYFVLRDMQLYYFKAKPRKGKAELSGIINLVDGELIEEEVKGQPLSFGIKVPYPQPQTYWLRGETKLDKKQWLLSLAKKLRKGGSSEVGHLRLSPADIVLSLRKMYFEKMLPLEQKYLYDELITPSLRRGDFDAKPMVLLLGQFSTGKTSFVRYLTKKNYPGIRIGPEPTTDKFIAIMYGEDERIIPGNALSLDLDKPFTFASNLGNGFLTKFEASFTPSEILKTLTFIDTPGILSGEKQRLREYDFPECAKWFANNSDMIILIFDGFKLDISDEVKEVIKALHGNSHKIKLVLNKADQLTSQQLLKVYGSLMWSLGKIIDTPENIRVYIGSFWEQPYKNSENEKFFISEERELIEDLHNLPKNSILRKISELVKRAKFLKSHIFTLEFLRNQIPTFGREKKQQQLCENIRDVFEEISKIRKFPITDFPSPSCYGKSLWEKDWNRMPPLNERVVQLLDEILTRDLPNFMSMVSPELMDVNLNEIDNPFDETDNLEWTIPQEFRDQMRRIWNDLSPNGEPLGGGQLKNKMMETGATRDQLKLIWKLVDLDKTGKLDEDLFILAMYLSKEAAMGNVPNDGPLPALLIPPSRRLQ